MRTVLVLTLVFLPFLSFSQSTFRLKNTDASAVFTYWIVPEERGLSLAALPVAAGGRHPVAPGETVSVTLPARAALVAVFVPWSNGSPALALRTPLTGGVLKSTEAPAQGALLVDRASFLAFNKGRELTGTLQEWGLEVPRFVLDGKSSDWPAVLPLLEWGPLFRPAEGAWPVSWPRLRTLQAVEREGSLWVRLTFENLPFPSDGSLLLHRAGAVLEWPLNTGTTVWTWDSGGSGRAVGALVSGGGVLEAQVPMDRLSGAERTAWAREPASWELSVTAGDSVRLYTLGDFRWVDLQ